MRKRRNNTGFTLVEMLAAVAIMGVLAAFGFAGMLGFQKTTSQFEYDGIAKEIFVAAQNHLTTIDSQGLLVAGSTAVTDFGTPESAGSNIYYYAVGSSRSAAPNSALDLMLPFASIDETVRAGGSYIIRYQRVGARVLDVFYSKPTATRYGYTFSSSDFSQDLEPYKGNTAAAKEARTDFLGSGKIVGWYGGDGVEAGALLPRPEVQVYNEERLTAVVNPYNNDEANLKLFIIGVKSGAKKVVSIGNGKDHTPFTYVIDDISALSNTDIDKRFRTKFDNTLGSVSPETVTGTFIPGEDLQVYVEAEYDGAAHVGALVRSFKDKKNSLFDEYKDNTISIKNFRHLQNLANSVSGFVCGTNTKAVLTKSVSWDGYRAAISSSSADNVRVVYGVEGLSAFKTTAGTCLPIDTAITEFSGNGNSVTGVKVRDNGNAGLFSTLNNCTVENVRLVDFDIRSESGAAGALAGSMSGSTINKTIAYNSKPEAASLGISGATYTGGLVGYLDTGSVDMSAAAVYVSSDTYAGGLIGYCNGSSVLHSYSGGHTRGGKYTNYHIYNAPGRINVIAGVNAGLNVQSGSVAGGLIGYKDGSLTINNCYTTCSALAASTGELIGNGDVPSDCYAAGALFKVSEGVIVNDETTPVPQLEEADRKKAVPYDSMLTNANYCYKNIAQLDPSLADLDLAGVYTLPDFIKMHYGDWSNDDIKDCSLVYYEKYTGTEQQYGFHGADVESTLTSDGIVAGDGYGIVYDVTNDIQLPNKVTISIGTGSAIPTITYEMEVTDADACKATVEVNTGGAAGVKKDCLNVEKNGKKYLILPLDVTQIDTVPEDTAFFSEVRAESTLGGATKTAKYYFNPHFAKTARTKPKFREKESISIRTPRHLYDLSRYYDEFFYDETAGRTFLQERNMDYTPTSYLWTEYTTHEAVRKQGPIGCSDEGNDNENQHPFTATYDGGCNLITNIGFESKDGTYVGMFGYNKGTIENVVLSAKYDPNESDHFVVARTDSIQANQKAYMGVLAGYNAKKAIIKNCAAAGYYISGKDGTLKAYTDSTLYAGGMVGYNKGSISNCSADMPAIRVSNTGGKIKVAGFVGINKNTVKNCYAIGHIEVAESKGGSVLAAGFTTTVDGTVSNCYCAVSIETSGETAESVAFAPKGGNSNNSYLGKGTYTYIGKLRNYEFDRKGDTDSDILPSDGKAKSYAELSRGNADASHSFNHPNTAGGNNAAFAFRAVVKDAKGDYVHYGDWQDNPELGECGMFYWERETGGPNGGYHMTYIGVDESGENALSDTFLCNAHDDNGVIDEFGYGYYYKEVAGRNDKSVTLDQTNISSSYSEGKEHTKARNSLQQQFNGYIFHPYKTQIDKSLAEGKGYLYLDGTNDINNHTPTGTWTIKYNDNVMCKYEFTPFFANAMRLTAVKDGDAYNTSLGVKNEDEKYTHYYQLTPGHKNNKFEIRNIDQLRYINWNSNTKNTTSLITGKDMSRNYPYLQFALTSDRGKHSPLDVEAKRPRQFWLQTHDVEGKGVDGYTPIAGMGTSTTRKESYETKLYAWFGGGYNGQCYKITNLNMSSCDCYSMGLFGVTVSADIENIILYSRNGDEKIERAKAPTERLTDSDNNKKTIGAYFVGGIVAIAYDYDPLNTTSCIKNCAVAGYKIIDNSNHVQGMGGANIGGIAGVACVDINQCSSVVDIQLNANPDYASAKYGSYYRSGVLCGSNLAKVENCYTGGEVSVSEHLRDTLYISNGHTVTGSAAGADHVDRDTVSGSAYTGTVERDANNFIYIGGISGGIFTCNFDNITGVGGAIGSSPSFKNCYTYAKLPDMEGNIMGVAYIAGPGDRYDWKNISITVDNCYYLTQEIGFDRENRKYNYLRSNGPTVSTSVKAYFDPLTSEEQQEEIDKILRGDYTILKTLIQKDNNTDSVRINGVPEEKSDVELRSSSMPDSLSDVWGKVPTTDPDGTSINGKYSFSSDPAQEEKNYPYPAVIKQWDYTNDRDVYVHYGQWPVDNYHWAKGRATLDIFDDMQENGYAEGEFYLKYDKDQNLNPNIIVQDNKAQVLSVEPDPGNNRYKVKIRAKVTGAFRVTDEASGATFTLAVTSDLNLAAVSDNDPTTPAKVITTFYGSSEAITLSAKTKKGADYSVVSGGAWRVVPADASNEDAATVTTGSAVNKFNVALERTGTTSMLIEYSYDYHGTILTAEMILPFKTYGHVGISDGLTNCSVVRSKELAVSGNYISELDPGTLPGPDMFIFTESEEGAIDDHFTIKSVEVAGTNAPNTGTKTFENSDYKVVFEKTPDDGSGDSAYSYMGANIIKKDGSADTVTVKVVLEDKDSAGTYTLSLDNISTHKYLISFNSGGAKGHMYPLGTEETIYTLPKCEYTMPGTTFRSWKVTGSATLASSSPSSGILAIMGKLATVVIRKASGPELHLQPGAKIRVTGDVILTAEWGDYTVKFDNNGGTGGSLSDMYADTGKYIKLPSLKSLTDAGIIAPKSTVFTEWNTKSDGSGTSYKGGNKVRNIAGNESEVTLYAIWKDIKGIMLMNGSTKVGSFVGRGSSLSIPDDIEREGWTLEGWYDDNDGSGVKILDSSGNIESGAENIEGITEGGEFVDIDEEDKVTLYACWKNTNVFAPVETLADKDNDGGTYIIADATNKKALAANNATSIKSVDVTIGSGFTTTGSTWYVESSNVTDDMSWVVTYAKVFSDSTNSYNTFTFKNKGNNRFLRDGKNDNNMLIDTDKYNYGGNVGWDYNNRQSWTYGIRKPGCLQSAFTIFDAKMDYTLYYSNNKSKWLSSDGANGTCLLLKSNQTVYTFDEQ